RILVVEDNPDICENICLMLDLLGYKVVGVAHNGLEALAEAKLKQPNIIFMDIAMPVLDGISATQLILEQLPTCGVIVLTASNSLKTLRLALLAGARYFIIKPYGVEELSEAVREVYKLIQNPVRYASEQAPRDKNDNFADQIFISYSRK